MDVLLKTIPLYTNHEEIRRLQSEPNSEELVASQISSVISQVASELLASVATELSSPNVHGCFKDRTRAEELRTSGNALFSKGKYLEAVQQFSESLRFLNSSSSAAAVEAETCVKVLCNRSLCLSKLKLHKLAEEDSTYAISMKPDHPKAYYRRSIAYRDQSNVNGAKKDAERAVKLLQEQGEPTEEAEALLASLLLEKCSISNDKDEKSNSAGGGSGGDVVLNGQLEEPTWTTHSVPQDLWNEEDNASQLEGTTTSTTSVTSVPITWGCSELEISNLTETRSKEPHSIKIAESTILGRHLVVGTQELKENIDIIQDQPVAHALAKHQRLHYCGQCCKELPLNGAYFWPCSACSLALFCSRECRDHENAHHVAGGPECGVPWMALLPPEVVLAIRLASRLKRDREIDFSAVDNSTSSASKVVSSLQTCFAEIDTDEAIWSATTACAAHAAWTIAHQRTSGNKTNNARTNNRAAPLSATGNVPFTVADVLRALCIVKINGLAIVPPAFGSKEDSIGIAVYPVASFLSHSCVPNVSVRFEGNTAIIRTLSTLSSGSPLLHCYGPQAGEMTTAQRRMMLKDQYHFICECDGCVRAGTETEEAEKEAEMVGLKCTATKGCLGAMPAPEFTGAPGSSSSTTIIDAGILSKYDLSIEDEKNKPFKNAGGCSSCGGKMSELDWNSKIAPQLATALESYSTGCQILDRVEEQGGKNSSKEVKKAIQLLEESLKVRKELLHKYNQVLGATHNALSWVDEESSAPSSKKNSRESSKIIHSRASLEIAERLFPADSTNIAFERLKLGTLLQQSGSKDAVKEGKDLASAAMITLERHFGSAAAVAAEQK